MTSMIDTAVVICHDDKITFRGQKNGKDSIGLDPDWKAIMPRNGDVCGYFQVHYDEKTLEKTTDFIGLKEYEKLDDDAKRYWFPQIARITKLPDDVIIHAEKAYVDIRMLNLWDNFNTRYRSALDALVMTVHKGITAYRGKGEAGSRQELEAMRRRFRRCWHAVNYEHDLIMPLDVGLKLIDEVREYDMADKPNKNTVYLKGYGAKESLHVKVYDMRERHGIEAVKLEVMLRQDYLERNGMKDPAVWEEQPDIQARIESTLRREWNIVFSKAKGARAMLAERTQVKQAELFSFMADTKNTLTAVLAKQAEHDRRIEQLERDSAMLKRKAGLK
jgi:hypothetical protein